MGVKVRNFVKSDKGKGIREKSGYANVLWLLIVA
jgi:hypothetical protein